MSPIEVGVSVIAVVVVCSLLFAGLLRLKRKLDQDARKTGCHDCLLQISDEGWADLWVEDLLWNVLSDGGQAKMLCPNCMIRRARRRGMRARAMFTTGPFAVTARAAADSIGPHGFLSTFERRVFSDPTVPLKTRPAR